VPIYVYRCGQCGATVERRQSFSDAPLTECEACGGPLQRVLQPVGIIFKGSGFYVTDNRSGSAAGSNGSAEKSESSTSETKKDTSTKPAETKSSTSTPETTSPSSSS